MDHDAIPPLGQRVWGVWVHGTFCPRGWEAAGCPLTVAQPPQGTLAGSRLSASEQLFRPSAQPPSDVGLAPSSPCQEPELRAVLLGVCSHGSVGAGFQAGWTQVGVLTPPLICPQEEGCGVMSRPQRGGKTREERARAQSRGRTEGMRTSVSGRAGRGSGSRAPWDPVGPEVPPGQRGARTLKPAGSPAAVQSSGQGW